MSNKRPLLLVVSEKMEPFQIATTEPKIHDGDGALPTGDQDAAQDGVGIGTSLSAITASGLAGNDGRSQPPIGQIVGGSLVVRVGEAAAAHE